MYRNILIFLLIGAFTAAGLCQTSVELPNRSAGDYLAGEHYPVIYTGQGEIRGSAHPCTTAWQQIGFSSEAEADDNRNIGLFNPEVFTVGLKLNCYGSGDSAQVSTARFESAYDTTTKAFWNGDSSNTFIEDGCYNHADYGVWKFEAFDDTARQWLFPVRAMTGGYMRLILESDIADTCAVNWSLICEH